MLDSFLQQIEIGYNKHNNPYHNAIHAADVTQAMHSLLWQTGLKVLTVRLQGVCCCQLLSPSVYRVGLVTWKCMHVFWLLSFMILNTQALPTHSMYRIGNSCAFRYLYFLCDCLTCLDQRWHSSTMTSQFWRTTISVQLLG